MAGVFRKAMVWLGIGPDDEFDDYGYDDQPPARQPVGPRGAPQQRPRPVDYDEPTIQPRPAPRPSGAVRQLPSQRPAPEPAPERPARPPQPQAQTPTVRPMRPTSAKPTVITPSSFEDAKQVADRFKAGQPVVMDLNGADRELSRRLIDFGSGLCYGLGGGMEKLGGPMYLLAPANVDVSAEERRRLRELHQS